MSEELPIFPLSMVLLPGLRVPLHIFEERYRIMTAECLEENSEFCLIYGSDESFSEVGCTARVTDVVNRFTDGRLYILMEGGDRIRVLERGEDRPYITGIVERVPDDGTQPPDALVNTTRALYVEALKLSIGWYRAPEQLNENIALLSFTIASALSLSPETQQTVLEETSIEKRYVILQDILTKTMSRMREHARKVSGNGKAH